MGEGIIESQAPNASIQVRVKRLEGVRLETGEDTGAVTFNVDVKMDELSRTGDSLTLSFLLSISTRPGLVKFEVGGTATITGGQKAFESVLEEDPESNVPKVLHTIYQQSFTSLFLLSTLIDSPYPPPDLLHSPVQTKELGLGAPAPGASMGEVAEETTEGAELRPEDQVAAEAVEEDAQQQSG